MRAGISGDSQIPLWWSGPWHHQSVLRPWPAVLPGVFEHLGLPIAMDKLEGSWSRLTYLGFELESSILEIWLLQAKLRELQQLISTWVGCKSCSQRELELLVGQLEHASQVAPGKIVMQRLFELLAEI